MAVQKVGGPFADMLNPPDRFGVWLGDAASSFASALLWRV